MSKLVTNIHSLRKQAGINQEVLANLVDVRRETIGKLENGKYNPFLKLAMDIAAVFGRSVEKIFTFTKE